MTTARLRAAFVLCSLTGSWLACAPAAPPPVVGPSAAASSLPSTFAVSFAYEPTLTLRLQQDGRPFEGDADLLAPELPSQTAEREPLRFSAGQAALTRDQIGRFANRQQLELRVGERTVPVLFSDSPFTCAQSVQALDELDVCRELAPAEDVVPAHCDTVGQRAWLKTREKAGARTEACWPGLDAVTLGRLKAVAGQPMAEVACERLLGKLGAEPSVEEAVKLAPTCLPFLPEPLRGRVSAELERRELPSAFAAAQGGSSEQMRQFYHRYAGIAPDRAEEIRQLAQRRFGPVNLTKFLSVRSTLEAQRFDGWQVTLCDLNATSTEVAVGPGSAPRFAYGEQERAVMGLMVGEMAIMPRKRAPGHERHEAKIKALTRALTGSKEVRIVRSCTRGLHWYLAGKPAGQR